MAWIKILGKYIQEMWLEFSKKNIAVEKYESKENEREREKYSITIELLISRVISRFST